VVRELSERDYGIDLLIEIFHQSGDDQNGNPQYESSGCVVNIQVKGTSKNLRFNRDGTLHYSMKKKALKYIEKFATPFFLFRVSISNEDSNLYFIWVQRYIKNILDIEIPDWRFSRTQSCTVKIPKTNSLKENLSKIESIASRIKYIEEFIDFRESFRIITDYLSAISCGGVSSKVETCREIKKEVKKIVHLNTLLAQNTCGVGKSTIFELLEFIDEIENDVVEESNADDYPNKYNLELLFDSIDSISSLEEFEAENEGFTVY
jgi:hypothetical protein